MPLTISNTLTQPSRTTALQTKADIYNPFSLTATPKITNPTPISSGVQTTTPSLSGSIAALFTPKVANAQTIPTSAGGASGSWTPAPAPAPVAQASYSGGQALPAVGSPEYLAAQRMAQPQQPLYTPPPTAAPAVAAPAPTSLYATTLQNYTDTLKTNDDLAKRAQDIADAAGARISEIGGLGARNAAGYLTTGTSPVGEGNAAITKQTTAAQQQAVAQGANVQLAGVEKGLTAQGQKQSGLGTIAGLAAPVQVPYSNQFINPTTGQAVNPNDAAGMNSMLDYYASQLASGKLTLADVPSTITSAPQLKTQLLQATQQKNPSYNPSVQGAQQASAADLTGQVSAIQAQANGAEANFNLMANIAAQGGVNDTNVPILNTLQQNVQRGLTSSSAVASFQSLIQSVRSQYAAILGGGTVTVESLNEAKSLIPDDISLSSLQSLGINLKKDAGNRVAGINQQIQSLIGGGGTTSSGGTSGSGTTSAGGYNFKLVNGQWVPA